MESIADWLALASEAARTPRYSLVGHSMGALACLEHAARYPERVERLALLGAAVPMAVSDALLDAAARDDPSAYEMITGWSHSPSYQLGGNRLPGVWLSGQTLRLMERSAPGVLDADLRACRSYANGLAAAAAVKCPAMVIVGERDIMAPPRASLATRGCAVARRSREPAEHRPCDDGRAARRGARCAARFPADSKLSITRHTDPDRFLAAADPLLARNPAIRSFAAAVVQGWRADPDEFLRDAYVATYASGGEHGFAARRRGAPLILENSAPAAARAFAADMPAAMRDLAAVGGEREPCEAFAERWNARFGTTHRVGVHMRHHRLTAASDVAQAPGRYRVATSADGAWLERASLAFAREAGLIDSREFVVEGARKRLARGGFRVWEDDGRAAFAGWGAAGIHAARIAPVYTEPAARRRGYATALVATLVRELLDDGRREIFLLTDLANPTSNAIYARIGFRPVSDTYRFDFAPAGAAAP